MLTSEDKVAVIDSNGTQSSQKDLSGFGCNCAACIAKRCRTSSISSCCMVYEEVEYDDNIID